MKHLALREHRAGNFAHAKTLYEQYLHEHPKDDETWHALGIVYAQLGKLEAAENAFKKALIENKNQATYHNSLGNLYHKMKQYDAATSAYKKAIKLNAHYPIAYNNLGNVYFQQTRLDAAEKAYQKAIDLKDNYADAYCNLGILYIHKNQDKKGKKALEKALSLNPLLHTASKQLGDYYLRHNDFGAAKPLFSTLSDVFSANSEVQHRLGICDYQLKNYLHAKTQFEITLRLQPNHDEAHQYLANTLLALRMHDDALQHYYQQLEVKPFFETYYNIAVLLMMKERFKEALIYFNEAESLNPTDAAIFINRGHIHLKRNETQLAAAAYQKALTLKPNDPEITHILSALSQKNALKTAPKDFVVNLFDQYAPYYDTHLQTRLAYETPDKIIEAITIENPLFFDTKKCILDLGCGTGLCGARLAPFAEKLIGIDLSQSMLTIAEMKTCYTRLIQGDIANAIPKNLHADLVVAGDVFTYIGDLSPIFQKVSQHLIAQGLFIFTVEKCQ